MANLHWPRRSHFRSQEARRRRFENKLRDAERAAKDVLNITHGGCLDGIGAAIMTKRAYGADRVGVATCQPSDVQRVLEWYSKTPARGRTLHITDLSLNPHHFDEVVAACKKLKEQGWHIEWRDHHHKQWEGVELDRLRKQVDVLEVSPNTESGASMQAKALLKKDAFAKRLAKTIRDRDLWLNEDPDSETLEFAMNRLGSKGFMEHMVHRPKDGDVVDDVIRRAADDQRSVTERDAGRLLGKTRFTATRDGERVGIVYGWLPKNVGLHRVLEGDNVQVAVNVRPNGHMSLRSRHGADVCRDVADEFDGGGHQNASGATLGLKGMGFWWYVLRRGRIAKVQRVADAAVRHLEARKEDDVQSKGRRGKR